MPWTARRGRRLDSGRRLSEKGFKELSVYCQLKPSMRGKGDAMVLRVCAPGASDEQCQGRSVPGFIGQSEFAFNK